MPTDDLAVCITGQLRVLVAQNLHVATRRNLLDPLGADAFLHVALHDTRAWGGRRRKSGQRSGALCLADDGGLGHAQSSSPGGVRVSMGMGTER